tara:strand:- start:9 stop:113 length:105 start_codon:yes stop_codon:yes gene_type:complete
MAIAKLNKKVSMGTAIFSAVSLKLGLATFVGTLS